MPYRELAFGLDREPTHARLEPQELKSLGKQASNMFLEGTCSLNEAVVKVARQHANISRAQVERILEHANSETFLDIFEKQAGDKNVEFDLAEPAVVFQALEKDASSSFYASDSDYATGPVKESGRLDAAQADLALMEAFGVKTAQLNGLDKMEAAAEKQKEASVKARIGDHSQVESLEKAASLQTINQMTGASPYPMSNPFGELFRTQQRMEKLAREAWVAAEKNSHLVKEAAGQLHQVMSNELLQGRELGEIVHAMAHVADESWVKQAMAEVVPLLESRGLNMPSLRANLIRYDMEKSAGARAPNPENPILQAFGAYVKLASEQPRLNEAFRQTQDLLGQVNDKVKEVMRSQHAG